MRISLACRLRSGSLLWTYALPTFHTRAAGVPLTCRLRSAYVPAEENVRGGGGGGFKHTITNNGNTDDGKQKNIIISIIRLIAMLIAFLMPMAISRNRQH